MKTLNIAETKNVSGGQDEIVEIDMPEGCAVIIFKPKPGENLLNFVYAEFES